MNVKRFDWVLNGAILFLFGAGLLSLASTAKNLFWLELAWGILAAIIITVTANFDWRSLTSYRWFITGVYGFSLFLLFITLFFPAIRGTRGWLPLGPVKFQTAEFAKLGLILILSYFFARRHVGIANLRVIGKSFLYFAVPALLILAQPDMGSALIIAGIWFGYLLVSGIPWRHLFAGAVVALISLALLWNFGLKPYQKDRIMGLFNPNQDPLGVNYNVIQAKIAIGSAGMWGKGFGQGTQVQLGFLPVAQSDFMFAAFTEEWGVAGTTVVLIAFFVLLYRIVRIAMASDNNFSKLICLGTSLSLLLHVMVNVGSNLGLMPVIGVPFPFLSYGGSNLVVNALLIGMIQSSAIHKRFS
ncbi:MAG: rod shape-determining protein RodA [Patescibacteria group bacterium]|nr:rod shape-determining protein RodA [Patescibacteria group bacterium]